MQNSDGNEKSHTIHSKCLSFFNFKPFKSHKCFDIINLKLLHDKMNMEMKASNQVSIYQSKLRLDLKIKWGL